LRFTARRAFMRAMNSSLRGQRPVLAEWLEERLADCDERDNHDNIRCFPGNIGIASPVWASSMRPREQRR